MAQGKKTFIFYSDWINMVKEMPDKDAGILLKHILSYVNDQNPKTDNILVKMAFAHMMPILKADLKRWESIRKKRKEAGAKGGKQTQANAKQMLANAKQVQAVNDNVLDSNINITTNKEVVVDFELLKEWKKEIGKSQIYLEGIYRTHKLYKGSISELLDLFIEHLKIYPKKHNNFSDFKKHFASWLNIKISKGDFKKHLKQSKGQL